jgi:hypothetical protein
VDRSGEPIALAIYVGWIALWVRLLALSIRSGQGALKRNLLLRG